MPEYGEKVLINYTGLLDDGREFESNLRVGKPLEVKIGDGRLLPAVEKALCDLLPGQSKTVRLAPAEAYGEYDPTLVIALPLDRLPNAENLPVGQYIEVKTSQGTARAKVVSMENDQVLLDLNHELAGHHVTFDLELLSVLHSSAIDKELHPEGCACGCDRLKQQIG